MNPTAPRPLWKGRTLALIGIITIALNLRLAVTSLSPIVDEISRDVPISPLALSVLGSLPPLCFALFGAVTPLVARRIREEWVAVGAIALILIGEVTRALAPNAAVLLIFTGVVCAGLGVGNVVLPPLIRRYFPDRVGTMTSVYASLMCIASTFPPLVAVPLSESAGWRLSLGGWALLAVLALVPWIGLVITSRRQKPVTGAVPVVHTLNRPIYRSRMAWAVMFVFATSSMNAYAAFAWLPTMLRDIGGLSAASAATALALFAAMGLPSALIVPVLAERLRSITPIIWAGGMFFVAGYAGLLLAPAAAPFLWSTLIGLGPVLFPLALILINRRTRTHAGSLALSGFVQGPGYLVGMLGPIVTGVLFQATGGWTVPIIVLGATGILVLFTIPIVSKVAMVEDGA